MRWQFRDVELRDKSCSNTTNGKAYPLQPENSFSCFAVIRPNQIMEIVDSVLDKIVWVVLGFSEGPTGGWGIRTPLQHRVKVKKEYFDGFRCVCVSKYTAYRFNIVVVSPMLVYKCCFRTWFHFICYLLTLNLIINGCAHTRTRIHLSIWHDHFEWENVIIDASPNIFNCTTSKEPYNRFSCLSLPFNFFSICCFFFFSFFFVLFFLRILFLLVFELSRIEALTALNKYH